jgi:hypothetical protein
MFVIGEFKATVWLFVFGAEAKLIGPYGNFVIMCGFTGTLVTVC